MGRTTGGGAAAMGGAVGGAEDPGEGGLLKPSVRMS